MRLLRQKSSMEDAEFQTILSYGALCLYSELHKLPTKVNKVNGCTQETRSFPQESMHLELPKLPEISNWMLFYNCCCLLWRKLPLLVVKETER